MGVVLKLMGVALPAKPLKWSWWEGSRVRGMQLYELSHDARKPWSLHWNKLRKKRNKKIIKISPFITFNNF